VLPAQSAPQIPSAQDAVAGVTEQPLMEVAQVLRSTWDDGGATAPAPKMDEVVCTHNLLAKGDEADFASDCKLATLYIHSIIH
jgi:hypothetical protein